MQVGPHEMTRCNHATVRCRMISIMNQEFVQWCQAPNSARLDDRGKQGIQSSTQREQKPFAHPRKLMELTFLVEWKTQSES